MGVRPEQIKICKPSDAGAVTGQIEVTELMGSTVHVHVTTPDGNFVLVIPANDLEGEGGTLAAGDSISFKLDAETIHVFNKQTGITLSWPFSVFSFPFLPPPRRRRHPPPSPTEAAQRPRPSSTRAGVSVCGGVTR